MQWIFKKRLESRLKLPPPFLLIFPDYCGQCRLKWKKPSPVTYRTQLIATIWTGFNEYSRFKGFLPSNSSFQTTSRFGNQICRRSDSWIWHLHLPQRVKKTETSNIRQIQISGLHITQQWHRNWFYFATQRQKGRLKTLNQVFRRPFILADRLGQPIKPVSTSHRHRATRCADLPR